MAQVFFIFIFSTGNKNMKKLIEFVAVDFIDIVYRRTG
jgi:hypothetical protein